MDRKDNIKRLKKLMEEMKSAPEKVVASPISESIPESKEDTSKDPKKKQKKEDKAD